MKRKLPAPAAPLLASALAIGALLGGMAGSPGPAAPTRAEAAAGDDARAVAITGPRDLSVTVYNENLGVVKDRRRVTLPGGTSDLTLSGVARQIDPTSVHLRSVGKGSLDVLWQEFHFDLASTERLLERYVDQAVEVRTKQGGDVRRGTLLSFDGQSVVLRDTAGGLQIITRSEIEQITLASLPQGVVTRPTLVWRVRTSSAGEQPVEVSYLTGGLTWHAEYVAVVQESSNDLGLQGWATMENSSGESYENARIKLVAGAIHRATPSRPPMPYETMARAGMAMDQKLAQRGFSEYYLYELPARATIATNEVKQLALLDATTVPARRKYTYDFEKNQEQVMATLELKNAGGGLGVPLPAGLVRIYQRDKDGALELLGEDRIGHTAKNETLRVAVGGVFDVDAERRQTSFNQTSPRETEATVEITLRNHRRSPIDVTVVEHAYGDWEVVRSSRPARKKDATTLEFEVRCPPEEPVTVTYTIRTRLPGFEPR